MDEFVSLLKTLKKNDKIAQNVLLMISESFRYNEEAVGDALFRHHRGLLDREAVLDFLALLCSKDARYLSLFRRYRGEFDADHRIVKLLDGEIPEDKPKRAKVDDRDYAEHEDVAKDAASARGMLADPTAGGNPKHKETHNKKISKNVLEDARSKNSWDRKEPEPEVLNDEYLRAEACPSILYPPNQCKLCGLRYEDTSVGDEQMGIHIDEHRRKARVLGEKDCVSREFFPTLEAWTKNIEKIKLKLEVEKVEKIAYSGGPALCDVCRSKIEVEWDDHEDSWMLKDAISLEKAGRTSFCHRKCVS
ncbi:hypothetical protein [Encephalitozoon cuniculi GB-M1]|uniref:Uncharacterized protein n=2 Tax=Encephalitozoon cuniculi TaxID=6035 RepID=Q8SUA7_ENCCU|nr:uncharacterized protein ECU10_1620 [Encephalitozoon cuniculi GB-M1]AGE96164.1 hypothetical protein ECU10_1620 [Encephalitozoon cuniculi]KMV65316.1 hypothetical protein M970_101570 [Encephalitozoon cuniculi EcunIII-L]UYI26628.1 hypothetical protein J0A71_02g04590 [Encephalitozoon cuniculi]CAD25883.1 hypothetical protein [Encephalitozoon cuniculi GB-M1]